MVTDMNLSRRGLLTGILALGVAPAIVQVANIMPVKAERFVDSGEWLRIVRSDVQRITGLEATAEYFDYGRHAGVAVVFPNGMRHGICGSVPWHWAKSIGSPIGTLTREDARAFALAANRGISGWVAANPKVLEAA